MRLLRTGWLALPLLLLSFAAAAQPVINIEIEGVEQPLEDNIRLFLSIEQQREHPLMSEGRIRRLHGQAEQEIDRALQPFGFYRAQVDASLEQLEDESWLARYVIDPGPGLTIASYQLEITGEMHDDSGLPEILEQYGLQVGAVFVHPQYESLKSRYPKEIRRLIRARLAPACRISSTLAGSATRAS